MSAYESTKIKGQASIYQISNQYGNRFTQLNSKLLGGYSSASHGFGHGLRNTSLIDRTPGSEASGLAGLQSQNLYSDSFNLLR